MLGGLVEASTVVQDDGGDRLQQRPCRSIEAYEASVPLALCGGAAASRAAWSAAWRRRLSIAVAIGRTTRPKNVAMS